MSANAKGGYTPRAVLHERVVRLKEAGLTFDEIAKFIGRSKSSITDAYYDPSGDTARERKRRRYGTCIDCGKPTYNSGAVKTPERCGGCHDANLKADLSARHTNPGRPRWTNDDILAALRFAAVDGMVTKPMYEEARRHRDLPSTPTIIKRFEFWAAAVEAAGLRTSRDRVPGPYANRMPKSGLLIALEDCWAEMGRPPTYDEFNVWALTHDMPSGQTIRNRFGSWLGALGECRPTTELEAAA